MKFNKDWERNELGRISKLDIAAQQKLILQTLVSYLSFIGEEKIRTLKDYKRVKEKIIKDSNLREGDEVKSKIFRELKTKREVGK